MIVRIDDIQSIEKTSGGYILNLKSAHPISVRGNIDILVSNITGMTMNTLDYILDNQDKLAIDLPLIEEEEE